MRASRDEARTGWFGRTTAEASWVFQGGEGGSLEGLERPVGQRDLGNTRRQGTSFEIGPSIKVIRSTAKWERLFSWNRTGDGPR